MKTRDLLHETSGALLSNKVRSGLTMLGIIIGIASVIAMLAIGQGAQNSIQQNIQALGSNLLIIRPGTQTGAGVLVSAGRGTSQTLTEADADAILSQESSLSAAVAPEADTRSQVVASGMNTNTSITGVTSSYPGVRNVQIAEGSFITDQNEQDLDKVAVLGPTARDDLFGTGAEAVGQTIRINGLVFTVVGITVPQGGSSFANEDDVIFIPLSVAQQYLVGRSSTTGQFYVSSISVEAQTQNDMTPLQQDITNLLLQRHNISDPANADFSIVNQAAIVASASSVTDTLTILLASVAGISLVVGGIGIMNMMLTTVTERTKEIGLRKAVGARKKDINMQFLAESVALTFIGGMIGIIVGWGVAFALSTAGLVAAQVSLFSILLSFGVSALIGIVFGYYPARRASGLHPIEALRYE